MRKCIVPEEVRHSEGSHRQVVEVSHILFAMLVAYEETEIEERQKEIELVGLLSRIKPQHHVKVKLSLG